MQGLIQRDNFHISLPGNNVQVQRPQNLGEEYSLMEHLYSKDAQ